MANTHLVSYSLVDSEGRRGNVQVYVPATLTLAQVQTGSDALIALIDAITGAKVDSAQVALALTLPGGLKASATEGEDIQKGANFGFDAADTPYRHTVRIPAVAEAIVNGDEINQADEDAAAFISFMEDGATPFLPSDRYANDLGSLLSAVVTFRQA